MRETHGEEPTATLGRGCLVGRISRQMRNRGGIRFDLLDDVLKVESEPAAVLLVGSDHATGEKADDGLGCQPVSRPVTSQERPARPPPHTVLIALLVILMPLSAATCRSTTRRSGVAYGA